MSDDRIGQHLQATKAMIAMALEQLKAEDPVGYEGACVASRRGAAFRVTTSLSVAGLCESSVDLVAPDGQVANIARVAFDPPESKH